MAQLECNRCGDVVDIQDCRQVNIQIVSQSIETVHLLCCRCIKRLYVYLGHKEPNINPCGIVSDPD